MQMYASRSCKEWIHFPCAFKIHSWIPFISPPPLRLFVSVEANSFNYSFNINVHYIWWSIFDRIRPIAIGKTKTVASRNPAKYPNTDKHTQKIVLLLLRVHRMCHRYQPSYLLFIVWIIHANRMTVTYVYLCMNVNRIPNRILNIHNFFFLLRLHTTRKRHRILWKWHIGTDRKRNGTNKRVKRKRRMEKTRQNVKMHNNKE